MERIRLATFARNVWMAWCEFGPRFSLGVMALAHVLCSRIESVWLIVSPLPNDNHGMGRLYDDALRTDRGQYLDLHGLSCGGQYLGVYGQSA